MNVRPFHAGEPKDEKSGKQRSKQHSHGRKHQSRHDHGAYSRKFGAHTTREKDYTQSDHADKLGRVHVAELYADSVRSESHAYEQKNQKQRQPYFIT